MDLKHEDFSFPAKQQLLSNRPTTVNNIGSLYKMIYGKTANRGQNEISHKGTAWVAWLKKGGNMQ